MKNYLLLLLSSIIILACNQQPKADYFIENGTIIDGLGNPAKQVNLLISNGIMEIVEPGEVHNAENIINATGLTIAPGFIDVHNHSDWSGTDSISLLNECFIRQGVTTIVGGPDGYHPPAHLRKLIDTYEQVGTGTNVAFYVGHNGIRREVMKDDQQRPPTDEELEAMKALVQEGMEMGAVGLSTGLMYEPGTYSDTEEIINLAKEVYPFGGIYDSHVRNPVHAFVQSHKEVIEISTKANITGKLGHLKAVGLHNEGSITEVIDMVNQYRMDGFTIVSDQYPYDGAQTEELKAIIVIPSSMPEGKVIDSLWEAGLVDQAGLLMKSLLSDKAKRAQVKQVSENGEDGGFAWLKATGYTSMRITSSEAYPELVGKYLSQVAEDNNLDPFESLCDLIINDKSSTFITLGGINEKDVQTLLVQPWNMIASDGLSVKESALSGGHPRSTGTFPRVLGHYVRDLNLLPLEEAIRKMTSLPADIIGFNDRGRIASGLPADIVVFNSETIIDRSTFEQPNLYSSGVIHVFVNGIPVLINEKMSGEAPGKYLNRKEVSDNK